MLNEIEKIIREKHFFLRNLYSATSGSINLFTTLLAKGLVVHNLSVICGKADDARLLYFGN